VRARRCQSMGGANYQADNATFICLRRGLGLKDGPGSTRAATVSAWLGCGRLLSPSARTGLADLALQAKVGQTVGCSTFTCRVKPAILRVADGERINPREECAFAPTQETTSTRTTSMELLNHPPCRATRDIHGMISK